MILIDREKCDLCGTCVSVCPEDCIELAETYLQINDEVCTKCELCVRICPVRALANRKDGSAE